MSGTAYHIKRDGAKVSFPVANVEISSLSAEEFSLSTTWAYTGEIIGGGEEIFIPFAQRPLEIDEAQRIVKEISAREGFKTMVRVCESLRGVYSVKLWDGSENNATILRPSHFPCNDPEDYATKTMLGLYFEPTPRNLELFCLLHELGHIKDMERKGASRYYRLALAQDRTWRVVTDSRLEFCWLRYIGQIIYMLLPLERQATKYALEWMKELTA